MVPCATRTLNRGTGGSFLGTNALLSTGLRDWGERSQSRFDTWLDDPQGIVSGACALQGVVALRGLCMSADFTVARFRENSLVPKLMNQRDFTLLGTHLASNRDRNVGMTQPRLWDNEMKSILDRSFRYTRSIDTDLRKTFARIRREQRQQAQAQVDGENPSKVFPIRQCKHAVAS
jgi:hypothetical protein